MSQLRKPASLVVAPILIVALAVCAGATSGTAAPAVIAPDAMTQDTAGMIPPGMGSLKQEDISISVSANGLVVRATPLDEGIIRTLAPDSYQSLFNQRERKRTELNAIAKRTGMPTLNLWLVSFFNSQQGEAQIAPSDVVLTNQGRDFKPLEVIGITPGFGNYRVRQATTATCILVFDGAVSMTGSISMRIGAQTGGGNWQSVVQKIELERSRIRTRAGGRGGI